MKYTILRFNALIHLAKIPSGSQLACRQLENRSTLKELSVHKWHNDRGRKAIVAMNCSLFNMTTNKAVSYGTFYRDKGIIVNGEDINSTWLTQVTFDGKELRIDEKINSNTESAFAGFGCIKDGILYNKEWSKTSHLSQKHRRSFIFQSFDGSIYMGSSDGTLTAMEVFNIMKEFNGKNGVILDGGGSVHMEINGSEVTINSKRKVANALCVYHTDPMPISEKAIILDSEHGMLTKGAETPYIQSLKRTIKEAEQNFSIMQKLAKNLFENGISVDYTNYSQNLDPSVTERTRVANLRKYDLLISLQKNSTSANSFNSTRGIETHICGRGGFAEKIAKEIQLELSSALNELNNGVKVDPKSDILRLPKYPCVAIKIGYFTNMTDAMNMINEKYQQNCADAISRGARKILCPPTSSIVL